MKKLLLTAALCFISSITNAATLYNNVDCRGPIAGLFAQGAAATGANWNVKCGFAALNGVTTGSGNNAYGDHAGFLITTGSNNLIAGNSVASTTLTTGSNNILIGTQSGVDALTSSTNNEVNIGNLIYGIGLGTSGTTPAGTVGIGTSTIVTGSELTVAGGIARTFGVTTATGRAVNTGTTTDTIAANIASTYESANSATITLTFAAPTVDGERRRVCLKNASTVTWAVTTPATAVAGLPTSFLAGQCVEAVYNSASGTPTNAPATSWVLY